MLTPSQIPPSRIRLGLSSVTPHAWLNGNSHKDYTPGSMPFSERRALKYPRKRPHISQ